MGFQWAIIGVWLPNLWLGGVGFLARLGVARVAWLGSARLGGGSGWSIMGYGLGVACYPPPCFFFFGSVGWVGLVLVAGWLGGDPFPKPPGLILKIRSITPKTSGPGFHKNPTRLVFKI